MQQELLIAVLAGLGGMVGWGLADFFAKKTIDQIGDIVTLAWGHVFGTLALLAALLYQRETSEQPLALPQEAQTWLLLVAFGVIQAIVYFLLYKGFGKGQVAVLSPVFAAFSGLTAIISIAVFGEAVSGPVIMGLIIIFAGILLINTDMQVLRTRRFGFTHVPGFPEVGVATVLAGLWTVFWGRFLGQEDWLLYTFLMYAFMTLTIIGIAWFQATPLFSIKPSLWKFLIIIGVFEIVAYLAIGVGYSVTSFISVVALLSGAFSLPTMVLARIFLHERITISQTVGSLIVIVGVMLLAIL